MMTGKENYVNSEMNKRKRSRMGEKVENNDSFVETTDKVGIYNYTRMKGGDKYIKDRGVNPYRIVNS